MQLFWHGGIAAALSCVCSSTSLLPVLEEEEEGIQESVVQVPTVEVDLAGRRK